jgi:hypothetical protein
MLPDFDLRLPLRKRCTRLLNRTGVRGLLGELESGSDPKIRLAAIAILPMFPAPCHRG